jgi:hypothetical protein
MRSDQHTRNRRDAHERQHKLGIPERPDDEQPERGLGIEWPATPACVDRERKCGIDGKRDDDREAVREQSVRQGSDDEPGRAEVESEAHSDDEPSHAA